MTHEYRNPDFAKWFIVIGVVAALALGWFAMGQPGVPLKDGDYGCSAGVLAVGGAPGATVQGGEVLEVWGFDMQTGSKIPLQWSDAKRTDPTTFTVTSEVPMLKDGTTRSYECELD